MVADLGQVLQGGRAEVDRGLPADRGTRPRGLQELLAGAHQVVGAGADAFRVARNDEGGARHLVDEQFHVIDQDRGEGLHALDGDALRDPADDVLELRVIGAQQRGAGPDLLGEEQLAAGRRPQRLAGLGLVVAAVDAALVGDLERADLLDGVAPELHPQGVLLGGREDVDQPAADGELPAPLDQVDPGVGGGREPVDDGVELDLVAHPQAHRLQLAEPGHHRLHQAADRADHHVQRPGRDVALDRAGDAAQHREPAPDGVRARGHPLVRQRLPRREHRDPLRRQQRAERGLQVLGLAPGGHDGEHGTPAPGQGGDRERARPGRPDQVERRQVTGLGAGQRVGQHRVGGDDVEQAGERHESS